MQLKIVIGKLENNYKLNLTNGETDRIMEMSSKHKYQTILFKYEIRSGTIKHGTLESFYLFCFVIFRAVLYSYKFWSFVRNGLLRPNPNGKNVSL